MLRNKTMKKFVLAFVVAAAIIVTLTIRLFWNEDAKGAEYVKQNRNTKIFATPMEVRTLYSTEQNDSTKSESKRLARLIQRRIAYIQNPKDCSRAKKLICSLKETCGFGCHIHLLTYCLIRAYATHRTLVLDTNMSAYSDEGWETLFQPISTTCTNSTGSSVEILNDFSYEKENSTEKAQVIYIPSRPSLMGSKMNITFMPPAIPEDLADRMLSFHGDPSVWWVGQFMKYLTRPQTRLKKELIHMKKKWSFLNPIVGVHVRRTDKLIKEAQFYGIKDYMKHVANWFDEYERRFHGVRRNVFLATDDYTVIQDAQKLYPNYTFISDKRAIEEASVKPQRYTPSGLKSIFKDVYFLSRSDFLVCTFSSNVGRAAYELMQPNHVDASQWYRSVDDRYFFQTDKYHDVQAIELHEAKANILGEEIDLQTNDFIVVKKPNTFSDHHVFGTNTRTGHTGYFPARKVVIIYKRVKMPTYSGV